LKEDIDTQKFLGAGVTILGHTFLKDYKAAFRKQKTFTLEKQTKQIASDPKNAKHI
jgi:hypothetical protein